MFKRVIHAYRVANEDDKVLFWYSIIAPIILICFMIGCLLESPGSRYYNKINNALFISCLMWFIIILGGRKTTKYVFKQFKILFTKNTEYDLDNYLYFFLLVTFIISIVAFLFVIDLSFLKSNGIRVSGVAGMLILRIIIDKIRYR